MAESNFDAPIPKEGIQIIVSATNQTNPISDMHIVHSNDESTYQTQPFNDAWLELLKPFKTIRFVDWGKD